MSITVPIPTPVTATQVLIRPNSFNISTPYKQEGNVIAYGEAVPLDAEGNQIAQASRTAAALGRTQAEILVEPDIEYTRPDNTTGTMKAVDIFYALLALYDRWIVEEQEKAKKPPPPPSLPSSSGTIPTWP